jgi:hypothetical protein
MARQLPFEVAPTQQYHQIGDEERGVLKFRKRRSISIPERLAVKEVDDGDPIFLAVAEFAVKVSRDVLQGQELHEVYSAVVGALNALQSASIPSFRPLEAQIALAFPQELQALAQRQNANTEALIVRQATVMIQNRLTGCQDWTDDDTAALDSEQLIVQIALFYRQEASGGAIEAATDAAKQLEELKATLGKLQQEAGSPSLSPTGPESTGDAETPTQAALSLVPIDSAPLPSPTSSTPSTPRRSGNARGSTTKS